MAWLAAERSWEEDCPEHGLEEVDTSAAVSSPCWQAFVSLQTLLKLVMRGEEDWGREVVPSSDGGGSGTGGKREQKRPRKARDAN